MEGSVNVFCLSGNIGSGKSTLLARVRTLVDNERPHWLAQMEADALPQLSIVEEDLDSWSYLLGKYYGNPEAFAFDFQLKVTLYYHTLYERALKMQDAAKKDGLKRVLLMERSPHDVLHVFLQANRLHMGREAFDALLQLHQVICRKDLWTRCCSMLFLKTPLQKCWERKNQRARFEESTLVPSYMIELEEHYESMQKKLACSGFSVIQFENNQEREAEVIMTLIEESLCGQACPKEHVSLKIKTPKRGGDGIIEESASSAWQ